MNRLGLAAACAAVLACVSLSAGCDGARPESESAAAEQNARKPAFLPASAYADLVTIDPSFPFGVTRRHAAEGAVLGARWGRHGGPLVTTHDFVDVTKPASVIRWTVPSAADGPVSKDVRSAVVPAGLPATSFFWGADGVVDLPFGSLAMESYTGGGAPFAGEILLYSADYDRVVTRARVNGYYSGVGVQSGARQRIVYSALSAIGPSAGASNGLYATEVCGAPPALGGCAENVQLLQWPGFSGPVAADAAGNVFVAAFGSGPMSDTIYGLTNAQTFAGAAVSPATIAEPGTGGTASLAAVLAPGSEAGWIVGKGYDGAEAAPVYARRYTSAGGRVEAAGEVVAKAIALASPTATLSLLADDAGHLWLALEDMPTSTLLELTPR